MTQQENGTNYRLVIILAFHVKFWILLRKLFHRPLEEKDFVFRGCLCRYFLAPFQNFLTRSHASLTLFVFPSCPLLPLLLWRCPSCFKQAGLAKLQTWKKSRLKAAPTLILILTTKLPTYGNTMLCLVSKYGIGDTNVWNIWHTQKTNILLTIKQILKTNIWLTIRLEENIVVTGQRNRWALYLQSKSKIDNSRFLCRKETISCTWKSKS